MLFKPRDQAGDQTEVGLIDQLTVGFKRVPAIGDAVDDGPWLKSVEQLIEIRIDQKVDDLQMFRRHRFQAPRRQPRGGCVTSSRWTISVRATLAPTKPLPPRTMIGP